MPHDDDPFQQEIRDAVAGAEAGEGVNLDDFFAHMPTHSYLYAPSRELWPATSINGRLPPVPLFDDVGNPLRGDDGKQRNIKPSIWLDRNRPVEQMTWAPGLPMIVADRLTSQSGWIERAGVCCFNLYRSPVVAPGDANQAGPWLDHVCRLFPDDAEHLLCWFAHRVQFPADKINHALVLIGSQGIGKDSLLEPVRRAIGTWNWHDISPRDLLGRFNGFAKSVVLRINEAHDLGEMNRFQFYDHIKMYTASPPEVLRVDEKHLHEYYVPNCCGVIITTNHESDGFYLPADDRRHYVARSNLVKEGFADAYWQDLWRWYDAGGYGHVAAWLRQLDLSAFSAKEPPRKTEAFWRIVGANQVPEEAELADAIDALGSPRALILADLLGKVSPEFADWLQDRKNRRIIPHRLERCGYVPIRNGDAKDGLWKFNGRRQAIYARGDLVYRDQIVAARERLTGSRW